MKVRVEHRDVTSMPPSKMCTIYLSLGCWLGTGPDSMVGALSGKTGEHMEWHCARDMAPRNTLACSTRQDVSNEPMG